MIPACRKEGKRELKKVSKQEQNGIEHTRTRTSKKNKGKGVYQALQSI